MEYHNEQMSLPSRERGLKFDYLDFSSSVTYVAPLAGARIEIMLAPLGKPQTNYVAPLAGARIEIPALVMMSNASKCRSPRGSED